tara:strand:- start:29 stop:364 length:336 start_codon:yes stop_codon:yes gene_type:complete
MYVIIQKGFALFGIGQTEEEAKTDAKEWLDYGTNLNDLPSYHSSSIGEICIEKVSNLGRYDKEIYEEQVFDLIKNNVRTIQKMKFKNSELRNRKTIRILRKRIVLLLSMLD